MNTKQGGAVPPISSWDEPKRKYYAGDRTWTPATEAFYHDMLGVMPPVYSRGTALEVSEFGMLFGCGEPYTHTGRGEEVFLWFRSKPGIACRLATREEIALEVRQALEVIR